MKDQTTGVDEIKLDNTKAVTTKQGSPTGLFEGIEINGEE